MFKIITNLENKTLVTYFEKDSQESTSFFDFKHRVDLAINKRYKLRCGLYSWSNDSGMKLFVDLKKDKLTAAMQNKQHYFWNIIDMETYAWVEIYKHVVDFKLNFDYGNEVYEFV